MEQFYVFIRVKAFSKYLSRQSFGVCQLQCNKIQVRQPHKNQPIRVDIVLKMVVSAFAPKSLHLGCSQLYLAKIRIFVFAICPKATRSSHTKTCRDSWQMPLTAKETNALVVHRPGHCLVGQKQKQVTSWSGGHTDMPVFILIPHLFTVFKKKEKRKKNNKTIKAKCSAVWKKSSLSNIYLFPVFLEVLCKSTWIFLLVFFWTHIFIYLVSADVSIFTVCLIHPARWLNLHGVWLLLCTVDLFAWMCVIVEGRWYLYGELIAAD